MGGGLDDMIGGLMISVVSGVVLGIAALLIVYKMIDGDIPVPMGLGSLCGIVGTLLLTARPPHPAIPAVVLVVALTLMAFFPFALNQLDKADLNSFDVGRLKKAYQALTARPDNFASKLEVAKALHSQGFVHQAIAIAAATLDTIPTEKDNATNRSLRDQFKEEDYRVKMWMRQAGKAPLYADHMRCRACNHENPLTAVFCEKCGNAYLLDAAKRGDNKSKVIGKLVLCWGLLALFIVGSASAGLALPGATSIGVILGLLVAIGLLFAWMFRRPGIA
jgi:ribosomal protein L40E